MPVDSKSSSGLNVVIMSSSAKPIWSQTECNDLVILRLCGVVQALRTSLIAHGDSLGLGDIQSLTSGNYSIVFLSVDSITLVAFERLRDKRGIEPTNVSAQNSTRAHMRLFLEYLYSQTIFSVTDSLQHMMKANPSLELQNVWGENTDGLLRDLLEKMIPAGPGDPAPFLSMGVETLYPLSPEARQSVSQVLRKNTQGINTLYAMLFHGLQLVTILQPRFRPHQLRVPDLHLLLQFLSRQNTSEDVWFPICLPHLHSGGFVHCYTHHLMFDAAYSLSVALISTDGSTEQFQAFRKTTMRIGRDFGLLREEGDRIGRKERPASTAPSQVSLLDSEDDYVDASGDGDGIIPYLPDEEEEIRRKRIVQELRESIVNEEYRQSLVKDCLITAQATHFLFRLNAVFSGPSRSNSYMPQCLSSGMYEPSEKEVMWETYQRLSLRLRLGSAYEEPSVAPLSFSNDVGLESGRSTIEDHCRSMKLLEAQPPIESVTYVRLGSSTYLGMSGKDFELYATSRQNIAPKEFAASAAKLARNVLRDKHKLFASSLISWEGT